MDSNHRKPGNYSDKQTLLLYQLSYTTQRLILSYICFDFNRTIIYPSLLLWLSSQVLTVKSISIRSIGTVEYFYPGHSSHNITALRLSGGLPIFARCLPSGCLLVEGSPALPFLGYQASCYSIAISFKPSW